MKFAIRVSGGGEDGGHYSTCMLICSYASTKNHWKMTVRK